MEYRSEPAALAGGGRESVRHQRPDATRLRWGAPADGAHLLGIPLVHDHPGVGLLGGASRAVQFGRAATNEGGEQKGESDVMDTADRHENLHDFQDKHCEDAQ